MSKDQLVAIRRQQSHGQTVRLMEQDNLDNEFFTVAKVGDTVHLLPTSVRDEPIQSLLDAIAEQLSNGSYTTVGL